MIWDNVEGVITFLLTLTESAPLSWWQFLIAAIVPAASFRYMQRMPCTRDWNRKFGRDTVEWSMETVALIFGILLAWLPWREIEGLLIGICAGLLSPYLSRGFGMAATAVKAHVLRRFGLCK